MLQADASRGPAGSQPSGTPAALRPYTLPMNEAKELYKRGFNHFAQDELDEAIDLYRQAIESDPALAIAWNGLSIALAQRGDFDEAITAANQLIELEPDDALSHTNLSRILMQQGKIPEAEDARGVAMRIQMKNQGNS